MTSSGYRGCSCMARVYCIFYKKQQTIKSTGTSGIKRISGHSSHCAAVLVELENKRQHTIQGTPPILIVRMTLYLLLFSW